MLEKIIKKVEMVFYQCLLLGYIIVS